jgi:hypothetical protein
VTIYIHASPEDVIEMARKLTGAAIRVQDAQQNRNLPNSYDYFTVGREEITGEKIKIRIGANEVIKK